MNKMANVHTLNYISPDNAARKLLIYIYIYIYILPTKEAAYKYTSRPRSIYYIL